MAATVTWVLGGTAVGLFLLRQYLKLKWGTCKSKNRLDGKTVIVTGANSGIGKVTALELAKRGAKVILACRNMDSGNKAAEDIRKATSGKSNVVVRHLDLASFASIRDFSRQVLDSERRLDVLINNAGVGWCPFQLTVDGYETQFAVNHLGHFLLTNLLLELIEKSAPSRVVVVSSLLYRKGTLNFADIAHPDPAKYDRNKAYCDSKLANIMFARELARRMRNKLPAFDSLVLSPGLVATNLGRYRTSNVFQRLALTVVGTLFFRTPWQGCQTSLYCAIADEVAGCSGQFFRNCKPAPLDPIALDDEKARQLWTLSAQLTGLPEADVDHK